MKKLLLLIPFLFLIGCNVQGDNDPLNLKLVFDPNPPDQNVTHYEIFWWQGDDTTNWNPTLMSQIDTVNHVQADSIVSPYFTVTFNYLVGGAKAVNEYGKSVIGYTRIYSYFEFKEPSPPENVRVVK